MSAYALGLFTGSAGCIGLWLLGGLAMWLLIATAPREDNEK